MRVTESNDRLDVLKITVSIHCKVFDSRDGASNQFSLMLLLITKPQRKPVMERIYISLFYLLGYSSLLFRIAAQNTPFEGGGSVFFFLLTIVSVLLMLFYVFVFYFSFCLLNLFIKQNSPFRKGRPMKQCMRQVRNRTGYATYEEQLKVCFCYIYDCSRME